MASHERQPPAKKMETQNGGERANLPILSSRLERHNSQPWLSATHDPKLLSDRRLLFLRSIDEDNQVLRRIIYLEELAYDSTQAKTPGNEKQLARGRVVYVFQDVLVVRE